MSAIVTLPDPSVPRLIDPDLDPAPDAVPSIGEPQRAVPPGAWVTGPVGAAAQSIHLAGTGPDGSADVSQLRGRVLLVIRHAGGTAAYLLHPEIAAGWAQGLAAAVLGAVTPPAAPPAPAAVPTHEDTL